MATRHLNENDIAERFDVTVRTVQKWRSQNVGPRWIVVGKHTIRYREDDVRAYEDRCLSGSGAPQGANDVGGSEAPAAAQ